MKQCTYCGAEFAEDATFCAVCGQPTQQPVQVQPEETPFVSEMAAPFVSELPCEPKKKRRWPWIAAGVALVLAAVAALYFFVLRKPEPTPPSPRKA